MKHLPVIFRKFKNGGDILAIFPTIPWSDSYDMTSYQHIGQHSACDLWINSITSSANKKEYTDLLNELADIGYDNLKVYSKRTQKMDTVRIQYTNPHFASDGLI